MPRNLKEHHLFPMSDPGTDGSSAGPGHPEPTDRARRSPSDPSDAGAASPPSSPLQRSSPGLSFDSVLLHGPGGNDLHPSSNAMTSTLVASCY